MMPMDVLWGLALLALIACPVMMWLMMRSQKRDGRGDTHHVDDTA